MDIDFAMFGVPTRSAEESAARRELRAEQSRRAAQAHGEALAAGATADGAKQAAAEAAARVVVTGSAARLIGAMAALNGKVRGLLVMHRQYEMVLQAESDGTWSASTMTDGDVVTEHEVMGTGATPTAALDDCAEAAIAADSCESEVDP